MSLLLALQGGGGGVTHNASVSFNGVGALTLAAVNESRAAVAFDGAGAVAFQAVNESRAAVAFGGVGDLAAVATVAGTRFAAVALDGSGDFSASAEVVIGAATPDATEQPSGGYFDYGGDRRRTPQEIRRERERFGITIEAAASVVIDEVAARQAQSLEQDAHKRFEELERELQAQEIEWRSEYLTALNAERERLITAEIAERLQAMQNEDIAIVLALLAACV